MLAMSSRGLRRPARIAAGLRTRCRSPSIAGQLGRFGVDVASWVSGDAGCDDPTLNPTAIRFDASGLDQATTVHLRIYIFRNRDAWERRLADVDACAAAWADDPATFEIVQVSPYVVAGQGPWARRVRGGTAQGTHRGGRHRRLSRIRERSPGYDGTTGWQPDGRRCARLGP